LQNILRKLVVNFWRVIQGQSLTDIMGHLLG
jgi:hypothetical protein